MHRIVLLSIDLVLVAISTITALILRDNLEISSERLLQLLPYLLLTLLAAPPVLLVAGLNRTLWRFSSLVDYLRVALAVFVIVVLATAVGFVFNRLEGVARALPILQGLVMAFALVTVRVAMRLRHAGRHRGPRAEPVVAGGQEAVLVVGLNAVTELFLRSVEEFAGEQVNVVGLLGRHERHRGRLLGRCPVLGMPEEIEKVLAELEVHGVAIARIVVTTSLDQLSPAAQESLLHVERTSDIELDFIAERVVLNRDRRPKNEDGEAKDQNLRATAAPQIDLEVLARRPYFRWKRTLDALAAVVGIVCLAPIALLIGLIVVIDLGPPPIFWQQRPGAMGRPFRLYKFRTMVSAHDQHAFADVERVSIIGRLLRRTRLDELPQLYNILVGEMSFVGPRPLLRDDQSVSFAARLSVRPGLTGWAQIKGGRGLSAADKAALDIWYVRNASLALDLKILCGTLRTIMLGERSDHDAICKAWQDLDNPSPSQGHSPPKKGVDDSNSHLRKELAGTHEGVGYLAVASATSACPPARKPA